MTALTTSAMTARAPITPPATGPATSDFDCPVQNDILQGRKKESKIAEDVLLKQLNEYFVVFINT